MGYSLNDVAPQDGKTVVVTGSNTGIGYATAKLLAQKGATIVLTSRNVEKGEQALARLRGEVPGVQASLLRLDLASLAAVREAAAVASQRYPRIDVLINNAGLMMPPLERTTDGFEMQFGTNVLGHFALTGGLLPLLQRAPRARVVWLSSVAHRGGRIDFDNLNAEKGYRKGGAYAQSKLADLMLAYEMQRRLQRNGSTVQSLAAHPGGTKSELSRNNTLLKVLNVLTSRLLQSTEDGAMPTIRAAVDPSAVGGDFYGPGGLGTMTGPATRQDSSPRSHDVEVARRLWVRCEQLTGVGWLS